MFFLSIGLKAHSFWLKILAQLDQDEAKAVNPTAQATGLAATSQLSNARLAQACWPTGPPFSHVGRVPSLLIFFLA